MTRICHVFDETAGWQQRVGARQLLDRLDRTAFPQSVVFVGRVCPRFVRRLGERGQFVPIVCSLDFLAAPLLRREMRRIKPDVIHAWGLCAARIAVAATDRPVVVELFEPFGAERDAKIVRSLSGTSAIGVVCNSERLRRIITQNGVPLERSTVIRPGVDFARINRAKRSGFRHQLDLDATDYVVMVANPSLIEGTRAVATAISLVSLAEPDTRFVLCDALGSCSSIERLLCASGNRGVVYRCSQDECFEDLISLADTLVVSGRGDVSTTAIAWAMASNTVVIGPAIRSVAELIGSGLNGMLYKPVSGRSPAVAIARLLRDRQKQQKVTQVARGHAYEVFGIRRRVDQILRVYQNVRDGCATGEGIVDSAMAG